MQLVEAIKYDARIRFPMRAFFLWAALHAFAAAASGEINNFNGLATLLTAALVTLLTGLELRLRRERIFLGNLGVSERLIVIASIATILLAEIVLAAITPRAAS